MHNFLTSGNVLFLGHSTVAAAFWRVTALGYENHFLRKITLVLTFLAADLQKIPELLSWFEAFSARDLSGLTPWEAGLTNSRVFSCFCHGLGKPLIFPHCFLWRKTPIPLPCSSTLQPLLIGRNKQLTPHYFCFLNNSKVVLCKISLETYMSY